MTPQNNDPLGKLLAIFVAIADFIVALLEAAKKLILPPLKGIQASIARVPWQQTSDEAMVAAVRRALTLLFISAMILGSFGIVGIAVALTNPDLLPVLKGAFDVVVEEVALRGTQD